jgi:mono/diheme cytochrome c family protein/glucose/arabinose dehydrogenase
VIPPSPALTPAEALQTFKVAPGFRIELVAAEPLVHDPVVMRHGADGRMWVVEYSGYVPDLDGGREDQPVGNVVTLEDTDGDGRMDKRTVFLGGLVLARAIGFVDGGVLVAEPPHLWFARDTDGDGRSDTKVEIANDYGTALTTEHNANALMFAMDNWIYNAKHTVRFRYLGDGQFARENTILRGQWGLTQDDWGRLYFNSHSDPLRTDLYDYAYLGRNRNIPLPAGINHAVVPPLLPIWPGRPTPGITRGYQMLRADGTHGSMTAACGPLVYRGDLFPADFHGNAFVAEPTGNLVKRIRLTERDGVVTGENAYEQTEFLTSTDERFRPVNLHNGPDGALYVVDMYRGIIQARGSITTYLRKQIDERKLVAPIGRGRIYRIVPDNAPAVVPLVKLDRATTPELVRTLGHRNGWLRDTAQQRLVERRDPAAAEAVRAFYRENPNPVYRHQALWTLEGLGALDRPTILRALGDPDGRVRAAAIRFAEKSLATDQELFKRVADLVRTAGDATAPVRVQLAFTLSEVRTPEAEALLRELVARVPTQPILADAVVSGLAGREEAFIESLANISWDGNETARDVVTLATYSVVRTGDPARIQRVLAFATRPETRAPVRDAVVAGVRRIVPVTYDGRKLYGKLPIEPTPLLAFASRNSADSAGVKELLDQLRWPNKPGIAHFNPPPLTAEQKALSDKGRTVFSSVCSSCHRATGDPMPGLGPPLENSRWATGNEEIFARIIMRGKATDTKNSMMPPLRSLLNDEQIAGVMTFVRRNWGHEASPVTPATVAKVRQAIQGRDDLIDPAELEALATEFPDQ